MQLFEHRSFHQACKRSALNEAEKGRCFDAIEQFCDNPHHPGLNFERLGDSPEQNHCSIRASQELRVILSVRPEFQKPEAATLLHLGHHDDAYRWAKRQGYQTDDEDVWLVDAVTPDRSVGHALADFLNFEEWQLFLHSEQRRWVIQQFDGAARIRGAAGTGKTVIALHRAAELGRRYPKARILYTSFVRSLVTYARSLYQSLSDPPDNVDFLSANQVARQYYEEFIVNEGMVKEAFNAAYHRTIPNSPLEDCDRAYLRDEVHNVIKGRAATRDEYLDTDRFHRIGRQRGFKKREREICWRLCEAWDEEMKQRGTICWQDMITVARDRAIACDAPKYRCVIIDEAQDMSAVGMQFLRAVVAGRPETPVPTDGLIYFDDSAQRLYPGGFLPQWAGLDIRNRSETLDTGHRTTRQITAAACAVRGDITPIRNINDDGAAAILAFTHDDGVLPVFLQTGENGEIPAIAEEARRLVEKENYAWSEIGIFMCRTKQVEDCKNAIANPPFSIPVVSLVDLRQGQLGPGARIGTLDRCKGLEFRAVFIARLGAGVFPGRYVGAQDGGRTEERPEETAVDALNDEAREQRQMMIDRLYVGMTRATKRLYLVADEAPCPEIEQAREYLDWYGPNRPFQPATGLQEG